ncbi:MAG: hypothetical protein AB7G28_02195 [Pirellulales bacterium]
MKVTLNLLYAAVVAVTLATPARAATMFFDFGDTAQQTGGNYNNMTPAQNPLFNVIDSNGAGTGIGLEIGGFNELGPNLNGTQAPTGDAAMFDVQATRDNLFGHSDNFNIGSPRPLGEIELTGLNPALAYDFAFFGSRTGVTDNRETKYTATGANSSFALLNASANTSTVAVVPGILPTAGGTIAIRVEAGPNNNNGSKFFYLGAMRITSIPEPTAGLLLLSGAIGIVTLRRAPASRRHS